MESAEEAARQSIQRYMKSLHSVQSARLESSQLEKVWLGQLMSRRGI